MLPFIAVCLLAVGQASLIPSSQYQIQDGLGGYTFGHSGGPNARHETRNPNGVTTGDYSYVDANGLVQTAVYASDPVNGFRVSATNLPAATPGAQPAVAPLVVASPSIPCDTPEVAAAKVAHATAYASAFTNPWYGLAPLNLDGTVAHTPEYKAVAAAHAVAYNQEASRVASYPVGGIAYLNRGVSPAPLNPDGTVAHTPEFKAVAAVHAAAYNEEVSRLGNQASLIGSHTELSSPSNSLIAEPAPLNPDGTVAHTPEYKSVAAVHSAAHTQQLSQLANQAALAASHPDVSSVSNSVVAHSVAETPVVQSVTASLHAAHAAAQGVREFNPISIYNPYRWTSLNSGSWRYPVSFRYPVGGAIPLSPHVYAAGTPGVEHVVCPVVAEPAPLNPDGTVAHTPEYKAVAAVHAAAQSQELIKTAHHAAAQGLRTAQIPIYKSYGWIPQTGSFSYPIGVRYPIGGGAPLNADGTVAETPEVAAARAVHNEAKLQALSRNRRSAPLNPDGTVAQTLEVQAATAAHAAAHEEERQRTLIENGVIPNVFPYRFAPYSAYPYSAYTSWPTVSSPWLGINKFAPLNPDGTVAPTPEVQALTAFHAGAHAQELARLSSGRVESRGLVAPVNPIKTGGIYYAPAPLNFDGTVASTPEVQAATAVHLAAHAQEIMRLAQQEVVAAPTTEIPETTSKIVESPAPLNPDGTVAETPEVRAATAAHLALHSQARLALMQ